MTLSRKDKWDCNTAWWLMVLGAVLIVAMDLSSKFVTNVYTWVIYTVFWIAVISFATGMGGWFVREREHRRL